MIFFSFSPSFSRLMLAILLVLGMSLSVIFPPVQAASQFDSEAIVNDLAWNNTEQIQRMDLTSTGQPRVAYADLTTNALHYGECSTNCHVAANWTFAQVDNGVISVREIDFTLDDSDNPRIASAGNFYSCDTDCTNAVNWTETTGVYGVARYVSIAIRSDGAPRIAHGNLSGDTNYSFCDLNCDQALNWTTIAVTSNSGGFTDLALTSDDRPRITHVQSNGNRALQYTACEALCTDALNWISVEIDPGQGFYTAIALDSSDNPRVVSGGGNFSFCDANCTVPGNWTIVPLGLSGNSYQKMLINPLNDNPRIMRGSALYSFCDANCDQAGNWTLDQSLFPTGLGGIPMTSAAVDPTGNVHVTQVVGNSPGTIYYTSFQDLVTVLSTTPQSFTAGIAEGTALQVVVDDILDTATVTANSFRVFGSLSGLLSGVLSFSTTTFLNDTITFTPAAPFLVGERVSLSMLQSIEDTGDHLLKPFSTEWFVEAPEGMGNFQPSVDIAAPGGTFPYSLCTGDFNGDGDNDVALGSNTGLISIYSNDGAANFTRTDYASDRDFVIHCADLNNDGHDDVIGIDGSPGSSIRVLLSNGDDSFAASVDYPAGGEYNITTNDFNADGFLDIAIPSGLGFFVLLNDTDGTFGAPVFYNLGLALNDANGIFSADFNGDGVVDMAVMEDGDFQAPDIAIALGRGDGTFGFRIHDYVLSGNTDGRDVLGGDLNGDNIIDLVTIHAGNDFSVLIGNGDGSFVNPVGYTLFAGGTCVNADLADIDADGDLDVVAACGGAAGGIAQNDGSGVFSLLIDQVGGSGSYNGVAIADLNGDDALDIVWGDNGDGDVDLSLQMLAPPLVVNSILPAQNALDVSQSSTVQIVFDASLNPASATQANVPVHGGFTGLVDGVYALSTTTVANDTLIFTPTNPFRVGEQVFVTVSNALESALGGSVSGGFTSEFRVESTSGAGVFAPKVDFNTAGSVANVRAGDVDNDGHIDLVTSHGISTIVSVQINDGTGAFPTSVPYSVVVNVQRFRLVDLNGDGFLDIAITAGSGGNENMHVLLNNGDGTFAAFVAYPLGANGSNVDYCDYDGDGDIDLMTPLNGGQLAVLANNGDGTFAAVMTLAGGSAASDVSCGDVNGDGFLDLVRTDFTDGDLSVYLNNGDGTFAPQVNYANGNGTLLIELSDLDADGDLDAPVITSVAGDDPLSIQLNDANGVFAAPNDFTSGEAAGFFDIGDLNSDGALDVAIANGNESTISVFLNDGSASFVGPTKLTGPLFNNGSAIADINGDGALDIATIGGGNDLSIFLNANNAAPVATAPLGVLQATDGSGQIAFQTTVSDADNDTTRLQVEYSDDGGVTFYDAELVSVTPDAGTVSLDNTEAFQIGEVDRIDSDGGAVNLTIVWDSQSASNGNGAVVGEQSDIQLRVTPDDGLSTGAEQATLDFVIDNLAPAGLGALQAGQSQQTSQVLNWTAVTEANFSHYEIWYGEVQADVVNRAGATVEWDDSDDANLATRLTDTTTLTGLDANTSYFFKIFAVDSFGNEETVLELSLLTLDSGRRSIRLADILEGSLEVLPESSSPASASSGAGSSGPSDVFKDAAPVEGLPTLEEVRKEESLSVLQALTQLMEWMYPEDTKLLPATDRKRRLQHQLLRMKSVVEAIAHTTEYGNGYSFQKPNERIVTAAGLLKSLTIAFSGCFEVEQVEEALAQEEGRVGIDPWWEGYSALLYPLLQQFLGEEYLMWETVRDVNILQVFQVFISDYCQQEEL